MTSVMDLFYLDSPYYALYCVIYKLQLDCIIKAYFHFAETWC